MKKRIIKKNELKKIDTVHNEIDKLFNVSSSIKPIKETEIYKTYLPEKEESFYDEKPITKEEILKEENKEITAIKKEIYKENKQETKGTIKTAVEKDIHDDSITLMNEKSSSDLLRAMEILHNPENLESNTILNNPQVIAMSVINYLAQAYDINFFKVFIKTFPRYRISGDDGRGRKEMIEIANAIRRDKEEEHQRFMEILGRR